VKQRITIENTERGTRAMLLLDRRTCRLSIRQARETFQKLAVPGFDKAGELGEWPLVQAPPECGGDSYRVVKSGATEGGMSNLYFLPVEAAQSASKRRHRRERGGEQAAAAG
jgi:hypothetical protein